MSISKKEYKYGFTTNIQADTLAKGLTKKIIQLISKKKEEPEWMLAFRLNAFKKWQKMVEPHWGTHEYKPINYQDISYYSTPKKKAKLNSLNDLDPELLKTFEKLGIPLSEQKRISGVAMDIVFDSVSILTTQTKKLKESGIIFCSISEAIKEHPDLVKKYLASVVPIEDNFFSALNSAVFTDGSFCYIPKGVKSPIDLSTYFRINAKETGQFERTLLIADDNSLVNYLEGCTAPQRDENQLHAAVVEIVVLKGAEVRYSTVQNWYAGDKKGKGGIYNFVTKRAKCIGKNSKVSWTQVEAGSAITWKYPSCILQGDNSEGQFYSVALTCNKMQADTGTKMIHIGKNTKSTIISKGISTESSMNNYRGQVKIMPSAKNARNYSQCDSMLVGDKCSANTFPAIQVKNNSSVVEHEASTSKLSEDQMFYLKSRGFDEEKVISLLVNGFCKEVFKKLPLEFSVEAVKLIEMKLENSVA